MASGERSMATARWPAPASTSVWRPPPQPISSTDRPPTRSPISGSQRSGHGSLVARDIPRAHGARAELVRHLAADIGEGFLHGGNRRPDDVLAIAARPFVRAHHRVHRPLQTPTAVP